MSNKKAHKNIDIETLEQLPIAIILFDLKRIYYLNSHARKIFGVSKIKTEELSKLVFFDFISEKYRAQIKKRVAAVVKGEEFEPSELEIVNFKGTRIQIEAKSNCVFFNDKSVCQSSFLEITKRKKTVDELASSSKLLENLSQYSTDIIFKYDILPKQEIEFISNSVVNVLGYEPAFFYKSQENIKKLIFEEEYKLLVKENKSFNELYKKLGKTKSVVIRFYHKNKSIVHLEITINPIYNSKKELISIIGNARDISQKIEIEQLLNETKNKFELIANNSNDIINFFSYLPTPHYLYVSPNIKKILGYSPEQFYKDSNFYSKRLLSSIDDFKNVEKEIEIIQVKKLNKSYKYTYQTTKANGEPIWLENNLAPIFGQNKEVKFFLNVLRDITAQKAHEHELSQKTNDYQQLLSGAPMACIIHNQGIIEYFNDAVLPILQAKSNYNLLGKFFIDFIVEKDRKKAIVDISNFRTKSNRTETTVYKFQTFKNAIIEVEIQSKAIKYHGKISVLSILHNLSERKQNEKQQLRSEVIESTNKLLVKEINERTIIEQKLIDQTARLKAVLESSSHLVWTVNKKLQLTSYNSNFYNVIKRMFNKHIELYDSVEELVPLPQRKQFMGFWKPIYKRSLSGESVEFEDSENDEKRTVYRRIYINPIISKNGEINEVSCIASDITEAKIYERKIIEQSGRLQAIFESGNQLMWSVNKKIELTNFNQNYYNAFYELNETHPQIGKTVYSDNYKRKDDPFAKSWDKRYQDVFEGKSLDFITERQLKDGKIIYRQVYLQPIIGSNKEVIEASGIAYDITDKIVSEQQVKSQTAKLKAIFESGNQFIWTVNRTFHLTSFNKEFSQTIYDIFGIYPIVNEDPYRVYPPDKVDLFLNFWHSKYKEVIKGKPLNFVSQRINMDGVMKYRQIYLNPIYNGNEVTEVAGVGFDITDKIMSEQKISNQAAKLNAIFDSSMHYIWTVDIFLKLTAFNKNYFDLIKNIYDTQPYLGFQLNRGILANDKTYVDLIEKKYKEAFNGVPKNFELELADKFGNKVYLEVFLNPIFDGAAVTEVSGIAHDITDKKTSQEKIVQSLREKEVLLKEVHHRVKNNMQVISSILNLQSSYVSDEYALGLLKESQNRIKTMAYIHESLYQNKTFATIDFADYISTLSSNIIQSYAVSSDKVKLLLNTKKVMLNLDVSIPAGLILNELVTNSIKHAFSSGKSGFLSINLECQNNVVILTVSDNGVGLPDNFDHKNTNSLGLQLVNTLTEQIDGTVEFKQRVGAGTEVNITFPIG